MRSFLNKSPHICVTGGACQVKRCEHFSPCTYSGQRAVCNCSVGFSGDLCDIIGMHKLLT